MKLTVYLSGEIHTSWRDDVETVCQQKGLDITFLTPVTDHAASDDCGVHILVMKQINSGMITKVLN